MEAVSKEINQSSNDTAVGGMVTSGSRTRLSERQTARASTSAKRRKVVEEIWQNVRDAMKTFESILFARLQEPYRSLEEQELDIKYGSYERLWHRIYN